MNQDPTRLSEEGFVADEISDVIAVVRQRYAGQLIEVRALNQLLTQSQYELTIHSQSAQEMTCAALFVRSLAHCQAALILLERGMEPSARAMIRCALEGLFNLGACAADSKMALSFVDADQVDRKRSAKYLAQVQDPSARASLDEAELAEILRTIQLRIDEVEAHEIRTREMARRAGLEDMYLTAYAMLSGAVHSTVGDLDHHFQADARGKAMALITAPVIDDLAGSFLLLMETMVGLVRAATKVFNLRVADQCEKHLQRFRELYPDVNGR